MRTRKLWQTLAVILGIGLLGASAPAQLDEDPEARRFSALPHAPLVYVDDSVLTVGQFGEYLHGLGIRPSGRRQKDLDTLWASLEAFTDEAVVGRSLDTARIMADPKSRRRARWRMAHRAGPVTFAHQVAPRVRVTQDDVEAFYRDSMATLFTAPSRREVRHLLVAPRDSISPDGKRVRGKDQLDAARRLIDSLKNAILDGASFDSIAGVFSDDTSSRVDQGYLGWIYPRNTAYDFDTATFAASVGEIRGPVKTIFGYHLIKVEAVRPDSVIALTDSIGLLIRRQLEFVEGRRLGTLWADSVMAATHWGYNDSALARVPDLDSSVWLVTLNQRDTLWWDDWLGAWEMYRRRQGIEGPGTLEEKRLSLRLSSFPFLHLQAAEDLGLDNDPSIAAEYRQFLLSEAMRHAKTRLYGLQEPPADLIDPARGLEPEPEPEKPLHLLRLRACDTATVWAAYRRLVAGDRFESVVRRYHADVRERTGAYDLGWVGPEDLPVDLWGKVWILEPGRYTRPLEHDSCWLIFLLEDRHKASAPRERRQAEIDSIRSAYREAGLKEWRADLRRGHTIRLDRSTWNRVQQLWRP